MIKKSGMIIWKAVLNEIYKSQPEWEYYGRGVGYIDDNHPLAKKLKISGKELQSTFSFLEEQKLIKYDEHNFVSLTEKGFNVALENEKHRMNIYLQLVMSYFTSILVVTTIYQFFVSLQMYNPYILLSIYIMILVIMLIAGFKIKAES
jgi:hypothetical protein